MCRGGGAGEGEGPLGSLLEALEAAAPRCPILGPPAPPNDLAWRLPRYLWWKLQRQRPLSPLHTDNMAAAAEETHGSAASRRDQSEAAAAAAGSGNPPPTRRRGGTASDSSPSGISQSAAPCWDVSLYP